MNERTSLRSFLLLIIVVAFIKYPKYLRVGFRTISKIARFSYTRRRLKTQSWKVILIDYV